MSKRQVSKKQSTRIEKKQKSYQHASINMALARDGLVITRFGSHALIEDEQRHQYRCSIRPNLDSLVAGDRIMWLPEGKKQGVIVSQYPRDTVLGRPDKRGQLKPVAANINQMMIVITPQPEVSWPLLDSYLVITEHLNLEACIILNKTDLPHEPIKKRLQEQYAPLGYRILLTNQIDSTHSDLEKQLNDHVSVFVGQSGVGKSSLIARVLPAESSIQTGAISEHSNLGRHTTSNSTYYHLPAGGALIDSPGVREFGLWHMPASEIAKGYREFTPFLSQCKFRDCEHQKSPGCALKKALQENKITADRFNNYIKIRSQFAK